MRTLRTILIWSAIAILAAIPTSYFFSHISNDAFADNAVGNWFATMVGALAGIGIALEFNRWQQHQAQKEREWEEKERKKKILRLIESELKYNLRVLRGRQPSKENGFKRVILGERLKDEVWNAFSDGGELQWIKDLNLIEVIATTYHCARTVTFIEDVFTEKTMFGSELSSEAGFSNLNKELSEADRTLLKYMAHALREIENSLSATTVENPESAG